MDVSQKLPPPSNARESWTLNFLGHQEHAVDGAVQSLGVRFSLSDTCASVDKTKPPKGISFYPKLLSATPFKYNHLSKHFTRIFIDINLGFLIFSNMPFLLFKLGFWSRLPINKWFFPHQQATSWRQFSMDEGRRDVLTVTDTRTICCLISSRAHTLNLMKSVWYLNASTLHNSTSIRSLVPWSLCTQTPTSLGVLQY